MNSNNNTNYTGYYYPTTNASTYHTMTATQQQISQTTWSNWTLEQQQHYSQYSNYNYPPPPPPPMVHPVPLTNPPPPPPPTQSPTSTTQRNHNSPHSQQYYQNNNNARQHFNNRRRFNNSAPQQPVYPINNYQPYQPQGGQASWQRLNGYKKLRTDNSNESSSSEVKGKISKKRKKPLSQNIPSRKEWSVEDARKVIELEKEHNKRFKNHSLIIKFPDLELNRDIVTSYHKDIENVHFQQPSTPRFCFVTLQESASPEAVIEDLNKIKFGDGYLTAEFKKDREEDQIIGPEDIDPLTLYVGNLVQNVTKEDMVKAFPKCRRIDIGYAKKMKYTRYAFVSFNNITDSVDAFKNTHSMQMYSKSLIVRFRRLHGTVGMPGECNTQNINNNKRNNESAITTTSGNGIENDSCILTDVSLNSSSVFSPNVSTTTTSSSQDVSIIEDVSDKIDLSLVKKEVIKDEDEFERKPRITKEMARILSDSFEKAFAQHRPIIVKQEIKEESKDDKVDKSSTPEVIPQVTNGIKTEKDGSALDERVFPVTTIKTEPEYNEEDTDDDSSSDESIADINFGSLLDTMLTQRKEIGSLRKSVP